MSSTYRPWPRMKRGSSFRLMEWPSPPISNVVCGAIASPLPRQRGRVLDRLDDVDVAGAAAEIAGNRVPDFRFARTIGLRQQPVGGHQHAGRAEAALQSVLLAEALLQRMQLAVALEPLDGDDRGAVGLDGQHRARLDRLEIDDDGAGAAVRRVAPDVRAGHLQLIAEEVHQQQARIDLRLVRDAVDGDADIVLRHLSVLPPVRPPWSGHARSVPAPSRVCIRPSRGDPPRETRRPTPVSRPARWPLCRAAGP